MTDDVARTAKIISRINELAAISEDAQCLTRTYGSAAWQQAGATLRAWMDEAGLQTRIDHIGNVRGILHAADEHAKTFVIASHYDTVVNAGRFDGPLGVIMGIDLMENLVTRQTALPFHIELIAFSEEEGVRFHTTFLGSKVVAGSFDNTLLQIKDADGITLLEVIRKTGGDVSKLAGDAIAPQNWLGYFEIHIEQGPVLYRKHLPAAMVTAIAGQVRAAVTFRGVSGHAGTVPMNMRRDALCGAAAFILETEKFALEHQDKMVATTGRLTITHQAGNVIAGEVNCSVDIRSEDKNFLQYAAGSIRQLAITVSHRRNLEAVWHTIQETGPVACDTRLNELLAGAITHCGHAAMSLLSGAGHDAVPVSARAPVCMLFIRCFEGISHNPLEQVLPEDITAGLNISENFIHQLIKTYNKP